MIGTGIAATNGIASDSHRITRALFDFTGRVAVVTGAASGLGEAIAHGLAAFGARVVATDVNAAGLEPVAAAIRAAGGRVLTVPCDVTSKDQVDAVVDQTVAEMDRLDIL